jgi:polyisoprenyl-phosphate glycosyltransferase
MIHVAKELISICIPVMNEEKNVNLLYERLLEVTNNLRDEYEFEFIFSDNNSNDDTWVKLAQLAQSDLRIRGVRFTKNVGFQESIWANLSIASGDAMVQIDADLQDPPELLHNFLQEWKKGYKVVYGIRVSRNEKRWTNMFRKIGYRFIGRISDIAIPNDAGDFRLIDRDVRDKLIQSKTPRPYIRGMIADFGFPSVGIPYSRNARVADKSKFPLRKVLHLGLDGILNHSTWPLRFSTFSGIFILCSSFLLSIYYLILKLMNPGLPQGLASIHILVLAGIGLNSFFLGVIGDYLNRIYMILRNEPRYIVKESINIRKQA